MRPVAGQAPSRRRPREQTGCFLGLAGGSVEVVWQNGRVVRRQWQQRVQIANGRGRADGDEMVGLSSRLCATCSARNGLKLPSRGCQLARRDDHRVQMRCCSYVLRACLIFAPSSIKRPRPCHAPAECERDKTTILAPTQPSSAMLPLITSMYLPS